MNSKEPFDTPLDPVEEAIFHAAGELIDAQARAAFLDRVCANEAALRSRIETLLRADQQAKQFFADDPLNLTDRQPTTVKGVPPEPEDEAVGLTIGRYKLLEKLGEGGCGVVYVAEQTMPVRRRVALKVIKLGMDTKQVVARFEAERQALAMMDHPNIAKVLDAGTTEQGRPYFVMELVRGIRFTDYCDQNNLATKDRLDLFITVCRAIQHAHQKGIIHRDIKPSNILVTLHDGVPVPKVIDFGIAKATEGRLTDATVYTQLHQFIGTPAYMSPEQAEMSGLDIDTRSDIYSLGVLLYELLVGSTPFDGKELMQSGIDAMRKTIREKEPVRPSTKLGMLRGEELTTMARRRSLEMPRLVHLLKGDLDWIVMKCLEKDRSRRYETANGLAADLKRHLDNEPVVARPPSTTYKFQKFVRRNKAAVTVTASFVVGLIAVLIMGTISYREERAARAAAEKSRNAEVAERQRAQSEATRAEAESLRARQFQYASDMNLAHQAVDGGDLFRALQLLDRHRPGFGVPPLAGQAQKAGGGEPDRLKAGLQTDLRGWEWRYLLKQCQGEELFILGSHSNGVTSVGFLPDGKTAFSGGKDNAVRLWDMASKRQVAVLPHTANVTGAACSPDGRWLATTTKEGTNHLLIWNLGTHQVSQSPPLQSWIRPNTFAFSPDSTLLAVATITNGVYVWSLSAGKFVAQLPARHWWVRPMGLAFSPNGQMLAYTDNEAGDIVLWNIRDQSMVHRLKGHTWCVTSLGFTPDGKRLLSGSGDRTVKLWDVVSGAEITTIYNIGYGAIEVNSPRMSPSGRMLAAPDVGGGQTIILRELPGGREIMRLRGHHDLVTYGAFSPDERTFISGSLDGTVRVWDLSRKPEEESRRQFSSDRDEVNGSGLFYSLAPDGRHLLTTFTNQTFSVLDIPALREGPRHPLPVIQPVAFALASGGELAAFVARDGNVVLWHGVTAETNWFAKPGTNVLTRAAFSPDGKRLAMGGTREVFVCDVASGKTLFNGYIHKAGEADFAFFLGFSGDGKSLMGGFASGLVRVWDFTTNSPGMSLRGHDYQVNGMALLPDGRTLVSTSRDIRFWNLPSETVTMTLKPRSAVFRCVAVSTDRRRVAIGANDGLITIWDLASKQEVATLAGHARPIIALSFLSDGETLVSVSVNEVRVWRAVSLKEADARNDAR